MNKLKVKDITVIAVLTALLFIQEQVFSFLPNIQLTVFLLVLYSKKLGFMKTSIIILIHVLLDNLVMGSFNFIYMPFMFIGWMIIPITLSLVFKKVNAPITLALLGILFSFIYSWVYIIPNVIVLEVDPLVYLVGDIWWEVILAASSFLSILWLYNPCCKVLDNIMK